MLQQLQRAIVNILMDVAAHLVFDPAIQSTLEPARVLIQHWPYETFNMDLNNSKGRRNGMLAELILKITMNTAVKGI